MTSKAPQKMPEGLERPKAPAAPPTRDMRVSVEYKLVPTEPTPEMLAAGEYALRAGCYASGIYADMLAAAPDVQGEPVGWQFYQHGEWWYGDNTIKNHRKNTQEAGFRVRDVYAAPQPVPDVSALVEALVACARASSAAEVGLIVDEALAAYLKGGDI